MLRAHLVIEGRVQGVFFRQSSEERASGLGLCGWVKNIKSGAVETVVEGPEEEVEEFVRWCRRGPHFAKVSRVTEERHLIEAQEYDRFSIKF